MGDPLFAAAEYRQLVVTPAFTRRIEVQHGRFTYASSDTSLHEYVGERAPWDWITPWPVLAGRKKEIQLELEQHGFHEGTMSPDLDGYTRYLSAGGL